MVVECTQGHENRVPDAPTPGKSYRCGRCGESLHLVWSGVSAVIRPPTGTRRFLRQFLSEVHDWNPFVAHYSKGEPRVLREGESIEPAPVSIMVPSIACALLLLIASVARLPHWYYVLLRIVVCGGAALIGLQASEARKGSVWGWTFGVTAILFNPLVPIPMKRATWQVVDLIAGGMFFIAFFFAALSAVRSDG